MPLVSFADLPDDARVWIFGSDAPIDDIDAPRLLAAVDGFLYAWKAHGNPLTCAREWRDEHFLVIGVDQRTEGASGCSVDGLFRTLQAIEQGIGASLVGGGRVYFRDALGLLHTVMRPDFEALAKNGNAAATTTVFDTTLTTKADYVARFVTTAGASWHAALLSD